MTRTIFSVRMLIDEYLDGPEAKTQVFSFYYTSSKYKCDCIGLQREIQEKVWEPMNAKMFIRHTRYFQCAIAKPISKDTKKSAYRRGKRLGDYLPTEPRTEMSENN